MEYFIFFGICTMLFILKCGSEFEKRLDRIEGKISQTIRILRPEE